MKIAHKDKAVLRVRSNLFDVSVPIWELNQKRQMLRNVNGNLTLVLEIADRALDIPLPNDRDALSFTKSFTPLNPDGVFTVRLISRAGRILSSDPIVTPCPEGSTRLTIPVLSETTGNLSQVQVSAWRCPVLDYRFDSSQPGRLITDAGSRWQGTLAGGWSYGGAFNRTNLPADAVNSAPQWMTDQGQDCLLFDGKSQYCHFPLESIPATAGFTLELQIKPLTQKRQYLIKSHNAYPGTVDLILESGKVIAVYNGQIKSGEAPYFDVCTLIADAAVPLDQWTTIRLGYDLKHLSLQVGQNKPVTIPYNRQAWWLLSSMTLGGWGPDAATYFHGMIKSLKINHGKTTD